MIFLLPNLRELSIFLVKNCLFWKYHRIIKWYVSIDSCLLGNDLWNHGENRCTFPKYLWKVWKYPYLDAITYRINTKSLLFFFSKYKLQNPFQNVETIKMTSMKYKILIEFCRKWALQESQLLKDFDLILQKTSFLRLSNTQNYPYMNVNFFADLIKL